jgi:putative flavoprotein involved in K+ transport
VPRDEVVQRLERYVEDFSLPVRYGVSVLSVETCSHGYKVSTNQGEYQVKNSIIATGLFQKPKNPDFSGAIASDILQISTGQYRNPAALPPGAVLLVGSAQSGCQVAEELYQNGSKVYLCVGSTGRATCRYRGRDVYKWLHMSSFLDNTPSNCPHPRLGFPATRRLLAKMADTTSTCTASIVM